MQQGLIELQKQMAALAGQIQALREENAARFETATFYPQLWIPAALEVRLPAGAQPGEYPVLLTVRDFQGNQTEAVRTSFTVTAP